MPQANRQKRVEVRIKVNLKYPDRETFVQRFSQNLSQTGIFVRASDPAPVGSRIHFEYTIGNNVRVLRGIGIVRWARRPADAQEPDKPPGMGLEFIDLDPQSDAFISQIVKEHGDGSRAPQRRATKNIPTAATPAASTPTHASRPLDLEEETALDALIQGKPAPKLAAKAPVTIVPSSPRSPAPELGPKIEAASVALPLAAPILAEVAKEPPELALPIPPDIDIDLDIEAPIDITDDVDEPIASATPEPMPEESTPPPDLEIPLEVEVPQTLHDGAPPKIPAPADFAVEPETVTTAAPTPTTAVALAEAVIDLCGAELVIATTNQAREVTTRTLAPRLALSGMKVECTATGTPVPGLVTWVGRRWPSAHASVAARRLGLTLKPGAGGDPALVIDGTPVSLLDALDACVRNLAAPLEASPPPIVTVVVPARTHPTATALVERILRTAGVGEIRTMVDAVATLSAAGTTLDAEEWALTIDLGLVETRVTLLHGPSHDAGVRIAVDCGLRDADELIGDRVAVELLRGQSLDVADDPSLRAGLLEQVANMRRSTPAGLPWKFSLAGSDLSLGPTVISSWCAPLNERIALLADALLQEHGGPMQALKAVVLTPEQPAWPGLAEALETLLGARPVVPEDGPLSRLRGAARA